MEDKAYLGKYVDGFKDALKEAALELQKNEHKERSIKDYGLFYQQKSNDVHIRPDDNKGYDEGIKDGYATIGQDLQDHEFKEYSIEDYGKMYENVAKEIGDCLSCKDIGTEEGCAVGQSIWCPRILETLKD